MAIQVVVEPGQRLLLGQIVECSPTGYRCKVPQAHRQGATVQPVVWWLHEEALTAGSDPNMRVRTGVAGAGTRPRSSQAVKSDRPS